MDFMKATYHTIDDKEGIKIDEGDNDICMNMVDILSGSEDKCNCKSWFAYAPTFLKPSLLFRDAMTWCCPSYKTLHSVFIAIWTFHIPTGKLVLHSLLLWPKPCQSLVIYMHSIHTPSLLLPCYPFNLYIYPSFCFPVAIPWSLIPDPWSMPCIYSHSLV